ncbi:MAG: thiamine pyrophosphate-dependent dehydrogenase E1 component subunit alpha [Acidimicrobiia bacterium]|nr:thiamine pyrophosphate-dependent dehydrogenase E1 component subunit alpha [Acidimicrobiia bacterium]MYC85059.1 thiamine pyrophosphate-dependent dehydrogenase E1 component subunit alpha [Acidimicrobiia bacterium]
MSPDTNTDLLLQLYRRMVRIRVFEEKVQELHRLGRLPGFVHVYVGEEAVAVGACSVLRDTDHITSTHRGHGHCIAKGADVAPMMAELFGRADGYCRGKGGSMHIIDTSLGILGANGIVGGGIPMATGSGLADSVLGRDGVTVCFFGDGAANQGVLLEALNLAAIWKLPVVYLCESNQYMEFTPTTDLTAGRIYRRGEPFGVASMEVDGNDVLEVRRVVGEAVDRARRGDGPTLIEAITYRFSGHSEGESAFVSAYRTEEEVESWKARDPVTCFRDLLQAEAGVTAAELDSIDAEEQEAVRKAVDFAEASPLPSPDEALDHVFAPAGG